MDCGIAKESKSSTSQNLNESKSFRNFQLFLEVIKENHSKIALTDNQKIRECIKSNIPPLKSVEELSKLYEKSFPSSQKYH